MRQTQIRKTPRRQSRRVESSPLNFVVRNPDFTTAEDVLDRINNLLETS